ncbi:unnamed protein product [Ilex paraguariensis]|uniref:Uncharacterized protein n=1 Tax=Ilex paraguariensis TaxID=185542 RepID=A0ABC8QTE8_9AQUA
MAPNLEDVLEVEKRFKKVLRIEEIESSGKKVSELSIGTQKESILVATEGLQAVDPPLGTPQGPEAFSPLPSPPSEVSVPSQRLSPTFPDMEEDGSLGNRMLVATRMLNIFPKSDIVNSI